MELEADTKRLMEENQLRKQKIRDLFIENQALRATSVGNGKRDMVHSNGHSLSQTRKCGNKTDTNTTKTHPMFDNAFSSRAAASLHSRYTHTSSFRRQPYELLGWKRCSLLLSEDDINEKLKRCHGDDDGLS